MNRIPAGAAGQRIVAGATNQNVGPGAAALERVVAVAAVLRTWPGRRH